MRKYTRAAFAAASALTLAVTIAACSTDGATESASDAGSSATSAAGSANDSATSDASTGHLVELEDGWAKATDTEMSGVFGTFRNTSDGDVHLTGVSGEIDGSHELHETVPGGSGMMMQEKKDGFVISAGGELVLEPGGNHIMLMDLDQPITTGQQIVLTLEFADGVEQDVTVSARAFEGGEENYAPEGHGDHGGHGDNDNNDNDDNDDEHGGADHDG